MRVLMFGTVYCDNEMKVHMASLWAQLHKQLNPNVDLMLVDSASPFTPSFEGVARLNTGDNIGHLARGGQDGWGRAFSAGLIFGAVADYDFIVHVEGDSLLRLPVRPICEQMLADKVMCASVPVHGTKNAEQGWVETGLMFFHSSIVDDVVREYEWRDCEPKRKYPYCPEWWMHQIVSLDLRMMPWSAERGDKGQITCDNVGNYDWVTHVSSDVATAFVESVR